MDDDALQKYFNFDEGDLFANRNGYLTDRQIKRLTEDEMFGNKFARILGLFLLIVALIPALVTALSIAPCLHDLCADWPQPARVFPIVLIALWTPVWGYFGIRLIRSGSSIQIDTTLKKAEGPVNLVKVESYNYTTHTPTEDYELHVGGEEFDADSDLADILMQGDIYAIYYIEKTKNILSAEMLVKGK